MTKHDQLDNFLLFEREASTPWGALHRAGEVGVTRIRRLVHLLVLDGGDVESEVVGAAVGESKAESGRSSVIASRARELVVERQHEPPFAAYEYAAGLPLEPLLVAVQGRAAHLRFELAHHILERIGRAVAPQATTPLGEPGAAEALLVPCLVHVSFEGAVRVLGVGLRDALLRPEMLQRLPSDEAAFVAPELLRGDEPSARSIVYSLGALAWRLVVGGAVPAGSEIEGAVERLTRSPGRCPAAMIELLARSLAPHDRRVDGVERWFELFEACAPENPSGSFELSFFLHNVFSEEVQQAEASVRRELEMDPQTGRRRDVVGELATSVADWRPVRETAPVSDAEESAGRELEPRRPGHRLDSAESEPVTGGEPLLDPEAVPFVEISAPAPASGHDEADAEIVPEVRPGRLDNSETGRWVPLAAVVALLLGAGLWLLLRSGETQAETDDEAELPPRIESRYVVPQQPAMPEVTGQEAGTVPVRTAAESPSVPTGGQPAPASARPLTGAATRPPARRPAIDESRLDTLMETSSEAVQARLDAEYGDRIRDIQERLGRALEVAEENSAEPEVAPAPVTPRPQGAGRNREPQGGAPATVAAQPAEKASEPAVRLADRSEERRVTAPAAEPDDDPAPTPVAAKAVVTQAPRLRRLPAASYPEQARRLRREADVRVEVLVNREGIVEEARIGDDRRFGFGFEAAALRAARHAEFEPGLRDGRPQAMWTSVLVRFAL